MRKFLWRLQYTIYGQSRTGWGWRLWWEWSDCDVDDYYDAKYGFADHKDAVREQIWAANS